MSGTIRSRRSVYGAVSIGATLALVVGAWLWARKPAPTDSPEKVARFLASEKFEKLPADEKVKFVENVRPRDVLENENLSEDERMRVRENFAAEYRRKLLDAYFALKTKAERDRFLDEQIDEQEKMRKLIEDPAATQPTTQPGQKVMIRRGGDRGSQKNFTENMPPGDRARMSEYLADMQARRAARGLPPGGGFMIRIGGGK